MSLADTFTSGLPPGIARDLPAELLDAQLGELIARAAAAHPGSTVDHGTFAAYLARTAGAEWPCLSQLVAEVAAEDLYLACACGLGDAAAIDSTRRRYDAAVVGYVGRLRLTDGELDDIRQTLWERLLIGTADEPPRILKYSGTGDLGSWIGIAAQRLALSLRRRQGAEERRDEALGRDVLAAVTSGPELRFLRDRYKDEFQRAVQDALASVPDRDRAILRLQIVAGLSLDKIAPMFGVNASTISRWAARARAGIVESARLLLSSRVALTPSEFASLAGALVSVLDVTLGPLMNEG
jgi:RNA polymerase sigma-70 factor (ECF subfamily)